MKNQTLEISLLGFPNLKITKIEGGEFKINSETPLTNPSINKILTYVHAEGFFDTEFTND